MPRLSRDYELGVIEALREDKFEKCIARIIRAPVLLSDAKIFLPLVNPEIT